MFVRPILSHGHPGRAVNRSEHNQSDSWTEVTDESKTTAPSKILVLEGKAETLEAWRQDLEALGYRAFVTADPEKARAILRSEHLALFFCDILVLTEKSPDLLSCLRNLDPELPVIVLTSLATIESAAETLRHGASYYLLRPVMLDNLRTATEQTLARRHRTVSTEPIELRPQQTSAEIIVGASDAVQEVLDLAARVARSDANIIISGESGTGKELFASVIHGCSHRCKSVFIPVDCASLPENLLEAELFGYEKGAFTGAVHTKPGLMELAHGGTLFFDEIAELPISLQPKLLRALQERRHRRLGGTKIIDFDVRVVSATNRDLRGLVAQRQFRQDLFYRLNVVPLHLPPLRARDKDVVLLANHFLTECGRRSLSAPKRFAPEVLGVLEAYSWPGNVRELQNVVQYSCSIARTETITLQDLPEEVQIYLPQSFDPIDDSSSALTFKAAKGRFESGYVAELLRRYNNNITQAAKAAGVDRKTFYALLKKHRLRSLH